VLQGNIRYAGNNQIISMDILSGTRIVANDGTAVESLTIQPGTNVPPPPTGKTIVSAVEFGPTGTTFSNPMTVIFGYDATQVPKGVGVSGLALNWYNNDTGKWVSCDYTVDVVNHQITGNISHFSLYAVIANSSSGLMGMGWSLAGLIIVIELVFGGTIVYFLLQRRRPLAPAEAIILSSPIPFSHSNAVEARSTPKESNSIVWDDILQQNFKTENRNAIFKTNLTLMGGKIIIPRDGKSADIELVNAANSQIVISLEYDPVLYPQGKAKIIVLGAESDNKKAKENIDEAKNKPW